MPFLELNDIKKHFTTKSGGLFSSSNEIVKAVNGVSLSIEEGKILGLVGESGCGKSTLSRLIMQLLEPTHGSIVLEGQNLTNLNSSEVRSRRLDFQMIFQDPYASLNPRMTVWSTLSEAILTRKPQLNKEELKQNVVKLMEMVGLDKQYVRKYPHEFSGGQRQRIAIARALAPEPKLIIADEPVSALDVSIQSQILNLLKDLVNNLGLTMLFISHDLSVVRYIADQIAVMYYGKIVEIGEAEALMENPQHQYTKELLESIPKALTSI
ncbi:ATP-binding cassette domain-containing protein [Verrucomicrobiales bacterium]|nr:ATP-binding cassette domain-containing protein [Verrucomicrobiales bacterium]